MCVSIPSNSAAPKYNANHSLLFYKYVLVHGQVLDPPFKLNKLTKTIDSVTVVEFSLQLCS